MEVSNLNLERIESKYLVPAELIPALCEFIKPYCELDPFCQQEADNFYRINSLYLDTYDQLFLRRKRMDLAKRFNMRVRSYGNEPKPPYFLEVKYKADGIVRKMRTPLECENLEHEIFPSVGRKMSQNHEIFTKLAIQHDVRPTVMTSYRRMAFVSKVDRYARVTFDIDLRYYPCNSFTMRPIIERERNYDNQLVFFENGNIVLELKTHTRVPAWMEDLIKYFNLTRTGFSKYASSMFHLENDQEFRLLKEKVIHF